MAQIEWVMSFRVLIQKDLIIFYSDLLFGPHLSSRPSKPFKI